MSKQKPSLLTHLRTHAKEKWESTQKALTFNAHLINHGGHSSFGAGWSSLVARRAHNPKVPGSNPGPATKFLFQHRKSKSNTFKQASISFLLSLDLNTCNPRIKSLKNLGESSKGKGVSAHHSQVSLSTFDKNKASLLPYDASFHDQEKEEQKLNFSIEFAQGKGLLTAHDRSFAWIDIKTISMQLPHIAFPLDLTGGSQRFKNYRCSLKYLLISLTQNNLHAFSAELQKKLSNIDNLKLHLEDDSILVSGKLCLSSKHAHFTFRIALLLASDCEIDMLFYDERIYGDIGLPSFLLPHFFQKALSDMNFNNSIFRFHQNSLWKINPVRKLMLHTMPTRGWKLPDLHDSDLRQVRISKHDIIIEAGECKSPLPEQDTKKNLLHSKKALQIADGLLHFQKAETAILRGKHQEAYDLYYDAIIEDGEAHANDFLRERLYQLGLCDDKFRLDTQELAEDFLEENPSDIASLLILAIFAERQEHLQKAASLYEKIATLCHQKNAHFDGVAADLACGEIALQLNDSKWAIKAFSKACARSHHCLDAYRRLFELFQKSQAFEEAARVGERLLDLQEKTQEQVSTHLALSLLYFEHLNQKTWARRHLKKALRIDPKNSILLETLAEHYDAEGKTEQAVRIFSQLEEQAQAEHNRDRIIALNLKLGHIWEETLKDKKSAALRYRAVLNAEAKHSEASLKLAQFAEDKGEYLKGQSLYENLLTHLEEESEQSSIETRLFCYLRLISLMQRQSTNASQQNLENQVSLETHVQRALELAPQSKDLKIKRAIFWQAARFETYRGKSIQKAISYLENILECFPTDIEVLDFYFDRCKEIGEEDKAQEKFSEALEVTSDPQRRHTLLSRITQSLDDESNKGMERTEP